MIISHVEIIAFQTIISHSFWIFYIGGKDYSLFSKQKNTWMLGNTRFISPIEHDISHSFSVLTCETCSTLEINLVFPQTHVLSSIYNLVCLK